MGPGAMLAAVRAQGLLGPGRPVLVMLSGGRDSCCLLDLAVEIAGPGAVTALHVNYGLRPGSDADAEHCRALCARLGVELEVRSAGRPATGNLHAWAREVRYAAADELAGARGADVAAGHTASDQVETVLYRLASSPSRRALLGMGPREGHLVRPLLDYTREDTAGYCAARGIAWREDPSNEDPRFARARVRRVLVPALREIHPAAERNVLALAAVLRDEAAVLDALVDELLDGRQRVELARLRSAGPALARLAVQRLADRAAAGPAAGVGRRTPELLALRETGTACLDVGAGLRAVCERGVLRFERLGEAASGTAAPYT
jgi:tRNA(Ile)-lysidine synthase